MRKKNVITLILVILIAAAFSFSGSVSALENRSDSFLQDAAARNPVLAQANQPPAQSPAPPVASPAGNTLKRGYYDQFKDQCEYIFMKKIFAWKSYDSKWWYRFLGFFALLWLISSFAVRGASSEIGLKAGREPVYPVLLLKHFNNLFIISILMSLFFPFYFMSDFNMFNWFAYTVTAVLSIIYMLCIFKVMFNVKGGGEEDSD